jgi:inner membrane protein
MLAAVERKQGERGKAGLVLGTLTIAAFIGVQAVASHQARRIVTDEIHKTEREMRVLDVSLTPFPSNPLCWTFVTVESSETDDLYRVRRGQLSLSPQVVPVAACPARLSEIDNETAYDAAMAFVDEEEGSLSWLRTVKAVNCHFAAWMRFARVPMLDQAHATDLRFGAGNNINFTSINLRKFDAHQCSPLVPHWDFPRADLLGDD